MNSRIRTHPKAEAIWMLPAIALLLAIPLAQARAGSSQAIVAWGYNASGQCTVPQPNEGYIAVAAGVAHTLALRSDGTLVVWGDNSRGQCNLPTPNWGYIAIACGNWHCLALRYDGSIVAWGWNEHGQCTVPQPNANFVAVAAGGWHSLALKSDGSIVAWGWNNHGQCNVPQPNQDFIALDGGADHSVALTRTGTIVAWGDNRYGQCNVPQPNTGYVAVAAGIEHCLGLKATGSIVAWGRNDAGQCNIPAPNRGFVAIASGGNHNLALNARGVVTAWGANEYGQSHTPPLNAGFSAIAVGAAHSVAIRGPYIFTSSETAPFSVREISLAPDQFIAAFRSSTWHVGGAGRYLAIDGAGNLWVTDNTPQAIQRMDRLGLGIEVVPVNSPYNIGDIEYHPGKNRLFAITRCGPSGSCNRLVEIDPAQPAQQTVRVTWGNEFEADYIAIGPNGNLAITSWTGGDAVRIYDAYTFALLAAAPRPPGGGNITGIAFLGQDFYVACNTYPTARIHKYRWPSCTYVGTVGPVFAYGIGALEVASTQTLWMLHKHDVKELDVNTGSTLRVLPNGGFTSGPQLCDLEIGNYIPLRGDLNCSGIVDFDDIDAFVLALGGRAQYLAVHPDCDWLLADCNGDGAVSFDDIDLFVARLGL